MNKGKPSGFEAETKQDAGAKSSSRPRRKTAGAGKEGREQDAREQPPAGSDANVSIREPAQKDGRPAADAFSSSTGAPLRNGPAQGMRLIHLEFAEPNARHVAVAGTFNDWRPGASEMVSDGDGKWQKDLLLSPGEYEYRFVVDGLWLCDPSCGEERPNGLGGRNSVLRVPPA